MSDIIIDGTPLCEKYDLMIESYDNQPPEPYTNYVEVPGKDGLADLSEASGAQRYKNRNISLVLHSFHDTDESEQTLTAIKNFLHGKRHEFSFDWEPEAIYDGRFSVSIEQPTAEDDQIITISINAEPFKFYGTNKATIDFNAGYEPARLVAGFTQEYPSVIVSEPMNVTIGAFKAGNISHGDDYWSYSQRCDTGENLLDVTIGDNETIEVRASNVDAQTKASILGWGNTWSEFQSFDLQEFLDATTTAVDNSDTTWETYADFSSMSGTLTISVENRGL